MALNITRGAVPKAQKVIVYGPEGVGKTSFAAKFPDPLFIDTEGSTEHYDVARTETPRSWPMLLDQVREVKETRPCATLVIDTADWAEQLAIRHVCDEKSWKSIEDPGYGKGYTFVVEEFGKLLNLLSDVAEAGVNVVLTAHAAVRKFDQPDEAASYNRWALALIDAAKMSNAAKAKEWADAVLFANYETIVEVVGEGKGSKGKARGGQKRVLHAQHHACWDAKNRWDLPPQVPLDFAQIAAFVPAAPAASRVRAASASVPARPAAPAAPPAKTAPAAPTALAAGAEHRVRGRRQRRERHGEIQGGRPARLLGSRAAADGARRRDPGRHRCERSLQEAFHAGHPGRELSGGLRARRHRRAVGQVRGQHQSDSRGSGARTVRRSGHDKDLRED